MSACAPSERVQRLWRSAKDLDDDDWGDKSPEITTPRSRARARWSACTPTRRSAPSLLVTPSMQKEIDALVFSPSKKTPPRAMVVPPSVPGPVYPTHYHDHSTASTTTNQYQSLDSHFGEGTVVSAIGENTTRLAKHKEAASMEAMNDRVVSFDPVYGTAHEGMDTASHFKDFGMLVTALVVYQAEASGRHQERC